ncbi:MAG: hypothetical protein DRP63_07485, partial [Planctomycetota bacterium]
EVRRGSKRFGFSITPLSHYSGTTQPHKLHSTLFASVETASPVRVGKYGVDVSTFEKIAVPELKNALSSNKPLIIIDEIGKMELASTTFVELLKECTRTDKVFLASVHAYHHPVSDELKNREDVLVWRLTVANREEMFERVLDLVCGGLGLTMRPIGIMRTSWKRKDEAPRQPTPPPATITIFSPYLCGAQQLGKGQKIEVVWFAHLARRKTVIENGERKGCGVFSLRTVNRPTCLGISYATILKNALPVIKIDRCDAVDKTLVADIKPALKERL